MGLTSIQFYQFTPITANAFGTHPAFNTPEALYTWLLGHIGASGGNTPATAVPGAVTNLAAQASTDQILLSWGDAAVNGSPVTDYQVSIRPSGGAYSVIGHAASVATTRLLTGLTQNSTYDVQVRPVSAVGMGAAVEITGIMTVAATDVNHVFQGDSLTANGYYLEVRAKVPLPNHHFKVDANGAAIFSTAVGGQTSAQVLASQGAIDNLFDPSMVNVCSIWVGRNDVSQLVPLGDFVANVKALHAQRQQKGFLTVAYSVTPSQRPDLDPANEALRQSYDDWLDANWNKPQSAGGLGASYYVNVGRDALLGPYSAVLNPDYYLPSPDLTHMQGRAQQRVADIYVAQVVTGLPNTGPTLANNQTAAHDNATLWSYQGNDWQTTTNPNAYVSGGATFLDADATKLGTATIRIATNAFRIPWNQDVNGGSQLWYCDGNPISLTPDQVPVTTSKTSPNLGPGPHTITTGRGNGNGYVVVDEITAITL